MKTVKVMITYDPVNDKFTAENPVKVYEGVTDIEWYLTLATPTPTTPAAGRIVFGTELHFPGIKFDADWPGTQPQGAEHQWHVAVKDTVKPGEPPVSYHYTINTWYQDGDRLNLPVRKSWDPDVEEGGDPPPPLVPPEGN